MSIQEDNEKIIELIKKKGIKVYSDEGDRIEIESSKLAKTLESASLRIAILACQKYLIKQGYQVIRIT